MPVTSGIYADVETAVFIYLTKEIGFNIAVTCGILANIERESSFNPAAINSYSGAYGLCQWSDSRGTALRKYNNYNTTNIQMQYLRYELENSEKETMDYLKYLTLDTGTNAKLAGEAFSRLFENHGDKNEDATRGKIARDKYFSYYSKEENIPNGYRSPAANIGQRVVQIARLQLDKPYITGGTGPDGYDDAGLVYYSYTKAGKDVPDISSESYYREYKDTSKSVSTDNISAGDLLFYTKRFSSTIEYVAISNGSGGRIYVNNNTEKVVEENKIGNPKYILRLLADSETSQGIVPDSVSESSGITNYSLIASNDPYANIVAQNLSRVESVGYDYGYLIDLTNTKESFKFYIPEFSESAGSNWQTIDITGRSVSILAYTSTSSRKITISLDLYAGVGVYSGITDDPVGKLHSDANFIKSLEYPDYTNPIVRPPATVQLILGSAVNIVGVVSGVNIEHLKPLDTQNRSMYLKVSFTVTQIAVNPPSYEDIRYNQYALVGTDNISSINPADHTTIAPNYTGGYNER